MKKKNHNEKRNSGLLDTIGNNLDLPSDVISGYAHIEMCGNRDMTVEGCLGVLSYDDKTVSLNTGRLVVNICGADLTIKTMQDGIAAISGDICGIDFEG